MDPAMKIYAYPSNPADAKIEKITNRAGIFKKKDEQYVSRIIDHVRKDGDDALLHYIQQFDSPVLTKSSIKVTKDEIANAQKAVDRGFIQSLTQAVSNIESFHKKQMPTSWFTTEKKGVFLGQRIHPVDTAGIYVPGGKGGKTPLVSSVLMCAIPAKVAGVGHICMASPPMKNGQIDPHLLVAAKKVGVDAIYKAGSAWAIAGLAYGTETLPRADVIVGPGNLYVTIAKKIVSGTVGIDMVAGPSEILVIADQKAHPEFVAADLLSQAEHDVMASAILVTTSRQLADRVCICLNRYLPRLKRRDIAEASLKKYGAIFTVPNMAEAIELANRIAPEHLELLVEDPFNHFRNIRHAGAVFMGEYTPEAMGDYIAGPNHVLPTAGTARFSSALSVENFIKKTSLLHYSKSAFQKEASHVVRLAEIEGLDAHADSVRHRLKNRN
jgi:histidinol dehydrogenase